MPGEGSPSPARLLRFPRRTLETPADLEPDREHFRHRTAPHDPLEGVPVEQDRPRDGVQVAYARRTWFQPGDILVVPEVFLDAIPKVPNGVFCVVFNPDSPDEIVFGQLCAPILDC